MSAVLKARDLAKFFMVGLGVRALRRVSIDVYRGEFLAITGPSGCGKSTLLNLLGALDRPTHGEVWLNDTPYSSLDEDGLARLRQDHIGFVFQFFNLLPDLTATENVGLPLRLKGWSRESVDQRAAEILEAVGLADRARHRPSQLSGGEQQRVAVARALAGSPSVILADEPTGNLDSASTATLLDILEDLNRSSGQTMVVVSHDEAVARRADRVLQMEDGGVAGEIVQTGGRDASAPG